MKILFTDELFYDTPYRKRVFVK